MIPDALVLGKTAVTNRPLLPLNIGPWLITGPTNAAVSIILLSLHLAAPSAAPVLETLLVLTTVVAAMTAAVPETILVLTTVVVAMTAAVPETLLVLTVVVVASR